MFIRQPSVSLRWFHRFFAPAANFTFERVGRAGRWCGRAARHGQPRQLSHRCWPSPRAHRSGGGRTPCSVPVTGPAHPTSGAVPALRSPSKHCDDRRPTAPPQSAIACPRARFLAASAGKPRPRAGDGCGGDRLVEHRCAAVAAVLQRPRRGRAQRPKRRQRPESSVG